MPLCFGAGWGVRTYSIDFPHGSDPNAIVGKYKF